MPGILLRIFQMKPAIYVANDNPHDLMGYIIFTYTFHVWHRDKGKTEEK
jgi:hypothetical protein